MSQPYPRTAFDPGIVGRSFAIANCFSTVGGSYDASKIVQLVLPNQRRRRLRVFFNEVPQDVPFAQAGFAGAAYVLFSTDINAMQSWMRQGISGALPSDGTFPGWGVSLPLQWVGTGAGLFVSYQQPEPFDITTPDPVYAAFVNFLNNTTPIAMSTMEEVNA